MSTATVASREVDVHPGPSRVRPVPRLGPVSTSVGERVPAVVLSFTPRSVPTIPVPMGDGVPAVPSSVPPDCPAAATHCQYQPSLACLSEPPKAGRAHRALNQRHRRNLTSPSHSLTPGRTSRAQDHSSPGHSWHGKAHRPLVQNVHMV